MTKERPILFSAPMVRAILAGEKIQTRRVVKPQPPENTYTVSVFHHPDPRPHFWAWTDSPNRPDLANLSDWCAPCPYGQPGDRLWVRETWAHNKVEPIKDRAAGDYIYRADLNERGVTRWAATWKPSIHMPRAASRILLEITGVRVERLQAISQDDAYDEGAAVWAADTVKDGNKYSNVKRAFQALWESINGAESWAASPWVWVVEFKPLAART